MRILFLNQAGHPDVVSTAQHLTDLAVELAQRGHTVRVICSRYAYHNPRITMPASGDYRGVFFRRIRNSRLGKAAIWRRMVDSLSFLLSLLWALATERRPHVVVTLTSPPLLPVFAAAFALLRRARLVYWAMDINPDEAIALGYLRGESRVGRLLIRLSDFSFRRASTVIALDRFMRQRVISKGIAARRVVVIPPWPHTEASQTTPREENAFLIENGLLDKFVVMHSGNHSPCHSPQTLLDAALILRPYSQIVFCFVGGGSGKSTIRDFRDRHGLNSILDLPYQSRDTLAASLSAADLHVVIMGEPVVGIVHPCKIYNTLALNRPILFIGPRRCHLADILRDRRAGGIPVAHGDASGCAAAIFSAWRRGRTQTSGARIVEERFSQAALLAQTTAAIEQASGCNAEDAKRASKTARRGPWAVDHSADPAPWAVDREPLIPNS